MAIRRASDDSDFWSKQRDPREPVSWPWRRIIAAFVSTMLGLAVFWGVGYLFASRVVGEDRWERLDERPLNYSIVMAVGCGLLLTAVVLTTATYTLIVDGRPGLRLLPVRRRHRA